MMPHPDHPIDVQINRVHSGAVREEIGERLSLVLRPKSVELPARLLALIEDLAKARPLEKPSKFGRIE
jgi:hypothetical protein